MQIESTNHAFLNRLALHSYSTGILLQDRSLTYREIPSRGKTNSLKTPASLIGRQFVGYNISGLSPLKPPRLTVHSVSPTIHC